MPFYYILVLPLSVIPPGRVKSQSYLRLICFNTINRKLFAVYTVAYAYICFYRYQNAPKQGKSSQRIYSVFQSQKEPLFCIFLSALSFLLWRKNPYPLSDFFYVLFHKKHPAQLLLAVYAGLCSSYDFSDTPSISTRFFADPCAFCHNVTLSPLSHHSRINLVLSI